MTTKTLYLHIGTPKTGTSTLQYFCGENRGALNAHGYDYPALPFKYRYTNPWRNGHFLLGYNEDADTTTPAETLQARREKGYAMLLELFERYDGIVLSDEALWTDSIKHKTYFWDMLVAHASKHGYAVKAIVYLRRQDLFAESMYNQLIKQGSRTNDFAEWVKKPVQVKRLEYYENLERIAKFIGRDAITVRVYDRAALDAAGGIHADFLRAVGLEMDESFHVLEHDMNTRSLSQNALAIKRLVNMSPDHDRMMDSIFREAAYACTERSQAPRTHVLSAKGSAELLAKYEPGNEKIAAEYLHREGPLFDAAQKDTEKWTPGNPYLYDDVVTYFQCVSAEQTKLIKAKGRKPREIPHPSQRTWEEYYSGITVKKTTVNLNVARCLAELFVLRQRDIEAGKQVAPLDDEDISKLAGILRTMSLSTARAQSKAGKTQVAPAEEPVRLRKSLAERVRLALRRL